MSAAGPLPPVVPPAIDVRPLLGPALIGTMFNWCLLGTLTLQCYTYYTMYNRTDRPFIKILVYTVLAAEIVFTTFLTHLTFETTIAGWGNPASLQYLPWSGSIIAPASGSIAAVVQIFFAWRCWVLNKEARWARLMTIVIVMLALLQFAGTIALTVNWTVKFHLNAQVLTKEAALVTPEIIWLAGSFSTDLLIALIMVISLHNSRRKSPVRTTDDLIRRLMVSTVETGVITAVVALVHLILFLLPSMHQHNYHSTPAFVLGKLYSNVLMANLNGRNRNLAALPTSQAQATHTHDSERVPNAIRMNALASSQIHGIQVSTTVHSDVGYASQFFDQKDWRTS